MSNRRLIGFGPFVLDLDQRVLSRDGEPLKLTPRDIDLLVLLVERAGRIVEKDELLATVWAGRAVEEGNIARHVATLRRILGDRSKAATYIDTVPKRGYRFIAPAVVIAAASPMDSSSPQPAAETTTTAGSSSVTDRSRTAWLGVAATAAVFAMLGAYWMFTHALPGQTTDAGAIRSLAVLPLTNLSGDPTKEYLADAMTEALLTDLAQIRSARVISRTSVMRYKETRESVPAIARELGVEGIVEGGVMVADNRVRVTAQLIDGRTDEHLWAESFEGDLRDVLSLQSRVSRSIAEQIRATIRPEEAARLARSASIDPAAYDAYARARYFLNKRTSEEILKSIAAFREATALDPSYARAFAGLADAYALAAEYRALTPIESLPLAESAARRALELDPELSEAHVSLAAVLQARWLWSTAEQEFHRALELNPGYSGAHQFYGEYLTLRNRHDEAIEQQRLAHDLDPVSLIVNAVLGITYYYAEQYPQAETQLRATLALDPEFAVAHEMLGRTYDALGEHKMAVTHFQRAIDISARSPEYLAALARSHARHGNPTDARALLEELTALAPQRYVSNFEFAMVYAALGDKDSAFRYLEAAFEERATWLPFLGVGEGLAELHADPRYADLLKRIDAEVEQHSYF